MKIEQLERGQAYYRLTYADPELTIFGIEPMVYVGINIFPDDDSGGAIYYFQDTASYLTRGAATDLASSTRHPEISIRVFPFSAKEIGIAVVSLDDVIAALVDARAAQVAGDGGTAAAQPVGCEFADHGASPYCP